MAEARRVMRQGRARGKRGEERASSAAALIGSRPLDVLIALAWGCRQGPVAIASAVGGGGCTGGDFFFSVGEGREGGPYPRTCRSLHRQHGRAAAVSTCRDTSYGAGTP